MTQNEAAHQLIRVRYNSESTSYVDRLKFVYKKSSAACIDSR